MSNPLSQDPSQNLLPSTSFSALNWEPQEPNPAVILQSDLLIGHINQNPNITALTPNPSDSLLLAQIEGSIATIDPNITLLNDNSFDGLTGEAMDIVKEQLTQFAKVPNFVEKMNLAFGESWDNQAANSLTQDWLNGDFSLIPPVKFVSSAEIGGANGAFAGATDTIYLSRELLTENGANPVAVADVLLEEIGHSVDSRLNVTDSPGDEGAIFGAVVQGKTLEPQELLKLKAKDDSGTAIIGGINFPIEQSRIKKQRDFNGDNISDLLRQEKGSWINNSRDAEVYLSNGSWGFKKQSVLPDGYWMNGDLANFIYGDFNGDAKTDFIRQEKGSWVDGGNDVQIFISKGDGTFQNPVNMNNMGMMNGNVANLIVGDFTGGGADDIIRQEKGNLVNGVDDTQFYTYSNGNFVKVKDVPDMAAMNGNYTNLIAGDFDGNGITDLLRQEKGSWINNTRDAEVYLSNGSWGFKQQTVLPDGYWMNGDLVNFIPGYFNADNKTDLIRQEKGSWVDGGNDVQILISKGDGTFQNPVNMNNMGMMNGNVANLIVGDFTGGGADDIIRQEKGNLVNGVDDTQFYTYSNGNFVKVKDVPDMAAMNGNFVNLAPKIDGASSYPYAAPPVVQTQVPIQPPLFSNPSASNPLRGFVHPLGQSVATPISWTHNPIYGQQYAVDFPANIGTQVYAMRSGTVVSWNDNTSDKSANLQSIDDGKQGTTANYLLVKLDDNDGVDDGYRAMYLHLQQGSIPSKLKQVGARVGANEPIGKVGYNGVSQGVHSHVEVNKLTGTTMWQRETKPFQWK
ncbi:M23 family metallopeptidase [Planktothrix agardhii]|uniref:M23 family metallopeptidase n=1 Tax=Planktothrix agardhii TaxID=1160 RepID=UPI0003FA5065|nr:M23 family metallopeptidase [Planktothrix agardhii]